MSSAALPNLIVRSSRSPRGFMHWCVIGLTVTRFLPGLRWLESSWVFRTQLLEHGVKWFSALGVLAGLAYQALELHKLSRDESLAVFALWDWLVATLALLGCFAWLLREELGLSQAGVMLPFAAAVVCGLARWCKASGFAQTKGMLGPRLSRRAMWEVALVFVGLYLLMPGASAAGTAASVAAPTAGGAFRQAALDIQTFTSFTVQGGQKYGLMFFSALATVHLPWVLIQRMFAGTSDLRGYLGPLLQETTILGLFGALLTRGPEISKAIIDLLRTMGQDVAGQPDITPQASFDSLVKLWDGETWKIALLTSEQGFLFVLMSAAVLVLCICLCVIQVWFEFEGKIAMDLSTVVLGAGGASWTRFMASNYFRLAFQCGLRLMITFVLQGLLTRNLDNWRTQIEVDGEISPELILSMLGSVLLLSVMMWRMHALLSAITSGNLSAGLDGLMAALPMGLLAGGTAAVTGAVGSALKKAFGGAQSADASSKNSESSSKPSSGEEEKPGVGNPSMGGPIPPAAKDRSVSNHEVGQASTTGTRGPTGQAETTSGDAPSPSATDVSRRDEKSERPDGSAAATSAAASGASTAPRAASKVDSETNAPLATVAAGNVGGGRSPGGGEQTAAAENAQANSSQQASTPAGKASGSDGGRRGSAGGSPKQSAVMGSVLSAIAAHQHDGMTGKLPLTGSFSGSTGFGFSASPFASETPQGAAPAPASAGGSSSSPEQSGGGSALTASANGPTSSVQPAPAGSQHATTPSSGVATPSASSRVSGGDSSSQTAIAAAPPSAPTGAPSPAPRTGAPPSISTPSPAPPSGSPSPSSETRSAPAPGASPSPPPSAGPSGAAPRARQAPVSLAELMREHASLVHRSDSDEESLDD